MMSTRPFAGLKCLDKFLLGGGDVFQSGESLFLLDIGELQEISTC